MMKRRGFMQVLAGVFVTPWAWMPKPKWSIRTMSAEDAGDIVKMSESQETEAYLNFYDQGFMAASKMINDEYKRLSVQSRLNRIKAKKRLREAGWIKPLE